MFVIALTGNLASGKSTVLGLLKKKGVIGFNVDKKIHQYYKDKNCVVYEKIAAHFPEAVKRGIISRKRLAGIAFSDSVRLKKLEAIVHPVIIKDLIKWINKASKKKGIYAAEVPLLFEKKLTHYFDAIILITVKRKILIPRIIRKYKFSKKETLNRLSLYVPIREKIEKSNLVVDNSLNLKELKKEVDLLWEKIKKF